MQSNLNKLIWGAALGAAITTQSGYAGGSLPALAELVQQEVNLQDDALGGLEEQIGGGTLNGLLGLGSADDNILTLLGILDQTLAENPSGASQGAVLALREQIAALRAAMDQNLPGGLDQLTEGMRAVGQGLAALPDTANPVAAPTLDTAGRLLVNQADFYDAMGRLDGQALSVAALDSAARLAALRNVLPGQEASATPRPDLRADLESTRLPLVRALLASLRQTQVADHFDEIMTSALRDDLSTLGGPVAMAEAMNGPAIGALPGNAPLPSLREGVAQLGSLFGPVAGLDVSGLEAIDQLLSAADGTANDLPNFAELVQRIPGLEATLPADAGRLVEGLLTPGLDLQLPGEDISIQNVPNNGSMPISQIAVAGLLDGGTDGTLDNLPLIGQLLETLLDLLDDLLEGLLGLDLDLGGGGDSDDDGGLGGGLLDGLLGDGLLDGLLDGGLLGGDDLLGG